MTQKQNFTMELRVYNCHKYPDNETNWFLLVKDNVTKNQLGFTCHRYRDKGTIGSLPIKNFVTMEPICSIVTISVTHSLVFLSRNLSQIS